MRHTVPKLLFLLVLLTAAFGAAFSQNDVVQIINPAPDTLLYCNDPIVVAPAITVDNIVINNASDGMKVSIANYYRGEDRLEYDSVPPFKYFWNNTNGSLEITGIGTPEEYQEAVRKVYYTNLANAPTTEVRSFSISLLDADYLPQTRHFYRFVKKLDITWTEARAAADTMSYYGLKGYLTTITSSVENDFIWTKIDGVGWIGATDEETEGRWVWATGPEAGTHFWQGTNGKNGWPVNNMFSFWSANEPNNAHGETNNGVGEDYGHINQNPNKADKSWNDLRNNGDGPNSTYYRPRGFIVEFGGLSGEPEVRLSASAYIKINKIAFSDLREQEICFGDTIALNLKAREEYSYRWSPKENMDASFISNPRVWPANSTTYRAVGQLHSCTDSAFFSVTVHPLPVSQLEKEYALCPGDSVILDAGKNHAYLWSTNDTTQTIWAKAGGRYYVTLENEYGCRTTDSTLVRENKKPKLDDTGFSTLICGSRQQNMILAFENATPSTFLRALNPNANVTNAATLTPTITVNSYGKYDFELSITNENGCIFYDTLNIEFHHQPSADFFSDEEKCSGYNLDVSYRGETFEPAIFTWYSNDTVFASAVGLQQITIPLGYGDRMRTVGLQVNEQGCVDEKKIAISVVPKMNFWVEENAEGCTPLTTSFGNVDVEEIASYQWDFGDGNTSALKNPTHTYENPGTSDKNYNVRLKVISAEGCENEGTLKDTVTVHPNPSVDLDFEENICYDARGRVAYTGSGTINDRYNWDLSHFNPSEIMQYPDAFGGSLVFERRSRPTVIIGLEVISEFGCSAGKFKKTWTRKPVFEVTTTHTEGCPPLQPNFSAETTDTVDQVNYFWDFGNGSQARGEQVTHLFSQADSRHKVQLTARSTLTGCATTLKLPNEVVVYPKPTASFQTDPNAALISNPVIHFENNSTGASSYQWDFGDKLAGSTAKSPTYRFREMGTYMVTLTALNDYNCIDSAFQQVLITFDKIFPPTAFSPNAAGEQDREFRIDAEGISNDGFRLLIFNRWGEILFESKNPNTGWNGKMQNGQYAPAGVYTWTLHYSDFTGKKHQQKGTVTLLF